MQVVPRKRRTRADSQEMAKRFLMPSLSPEKRERLIERLKSPDKPTVRQLAEEFGTSFAVINRLSHQIAVQDGTIADRRIQTYVRRLGRELPVKERVRLLAELARTPNRGGETQLRAIMRADELEGIVTAKERREGADNSGAVQPMFVLPPGSKIAVAVQTPEDAKPSDSKAIQMGRE